MRIVIDTEHHAVLKTDARGTLDLDGERVCSVARPADFPDVAVERTVLDLAAVVMARPVDRSRCAAKRGRCWKRGLHRVAQRHEIARARRHSGCRSIPVSGSATRRQSAHNTRWGGLRDRRALRMRRERRMVSKNCRATSGGRRTCPDRAGADVLRHSAHRPHVGGLSLRMQDDVTDFRSKTPDGTCRRGDRTAAFVKGCESAGVVVAGPAVEMAPAGGLQRRIGDFERPRWRHPTREPQGQAIGRQLQDGATQAMDNVVHGRRPPPQRRSPALRIRTRCRRCTSGSTVERRRGDRAFLFLSRSLAKGADRFLAGLRCCGFDHGAPHPAGTRRGPGSPVAVDEDFSSPLGAAKSRVHPRSVQWTSAGPGKANI